MEIVCKYFLLFLFYSFLGWILEMVVCSIADKKVVNRGFLIGPYCPIYGSGCLLIISLLHKYQDDPFTLFIMAVIVCSLLEYFTSYIMEKLFKARWWDYSDRRFNINGRICLDNLVLFGVLGLLIFYVANPFFGGLIDRFNDTGATKTPIDAEYLAAREYVKQLHAQEAAAKTQAKTETQATDTQEPVQEQTKSKIIRV